MVRKIDSAENWGTSWRKLEYKPIIRIYTEASSLTRKKLDALAERIIDEIKCKLLVIPVFRV
jgi:phosphomannomutase